MTLWMRCALFGSLDLRLLFICLIALSPWLSGCNEVAGDNPRGRAPEDFSGSWREILTGTGNSCPFPGVEKGEHIVSIVQMGSDATIDCVDLCGGFFCHLPGMISGPVLTSTFSTSSSSGYLFCFDNFEFTLAGTLQGNTVQGSVTQRYFRAGSFCPPELHTNCAITYAFEWTRCPPADCTLQICPTASRSQSSAGEPIWGR